MANKPTKDQWIRIDLAQAYTTTLDVDLPELVRQEIEECERALAVARASGDRPAEGDELLRLGRIVISHGQFVRGLECLQEAASLFHDIGDLRGEAQSYTRLGELPVALLTDPKSAREHLLQAMEIYLKLEDYAGVASGYFNLAEVYTFSGQADSARDQYLKALSIFRSMGDQGKEADTLAGLASVHLELGRVKEAIECSQQALTIWQEMGDRQREGASFTILGACYACLGQMERAIEFNEQALDVFRELDDRRSEATALRSIGAWHFSLRQMDKAVEATAAAAQIFDEIGGPHADEVQKELAYVKKITAKKWWQFWL